jgi:hypothetical protein
METGKTVNDRLVTQLVADLNRFVAGDFMLQCSDAWIVHRFARWQENEQGTENFRRYAPGIADSGAAPWCRQG